jgi:hypothetical protein
MCRLKPSVEPYTPACRSEAITKSRALLSLSPLIAVVVMCALSTIACSGGSKNERQPQMFSEPATSSSPSPTQPGLPIRVGMTWDECVPLLKDAKRITLTRHASDQFTDTYQISDRVYHVTFERPSSPDVGPYRIVRIEHADIKPEADQIDLTRQLKRGMSMSEALPLMQKVGGYFVLETKDRFAAILQTSDGTYQVTFERPKGVTRPSVIADATPEELTRSGRIPLNALPEFEKYRITGVKKND